MDQQQPPVQQQQQPPQEDEQNPPQPVDQRSGEGAQSALTRLRNQERSKAAIKGHDHPG